ncbi:hypothetical protein AG1IA_09811 [Rhizoctonia solani AG-1 IA]|uniref:Uncharacterized protein n=1 Tax=Thanatephorus cucumeris (strain AG1-IA) TaxID=983506 RepID=L8WDY7_THACA|nr:hypothetical protein AG1IA_09811 [Rhizoctonia solani AG-1 IA]
MTNLHPKIRYKNTTLNMIWTGSNSILICNSTHSGHQVVDLPRKIIPFAIVPFAFVLVFRLHGTRARN